MSVMEQTEIEPLLPTELPIAILDEMERRPWDEFEDVHETDAPIVPQIRSWAASNGIAMPRGWNVRLSLGVKDMLLNNLDRYVDKALLKRWGELFGKFA